MFDIVRKNPKAFLLALAIHLALVLILSFNISWHSNHAQNAPQVDVIQAVMIDEAKIREDAERKQQLEQAQQRKLEEEKRKKAAAEKQRQAEIAKKQREEEQRKQAALKKKQEEEKKRKAEAEAEAKRKQVAAEKKRQEELRQKQEAEKKRLAELEEKRKIEAERQRQLEAKRLAEEQRRLEEERLRQQQMAEEEALRQAARQRVLQSERDKYITLIQQRVSGKWARPSSWHAGTECRVKVRLVPGAGTAQVIDVKMVKSCGDPLFDRSVENAVYSASPLPIPTAPELIDVFREISFNFRPEG